MKHTTLAVGLALVAGSILVQSAEPTVNTDYLRLHAQTRGFLLGRPVKVKPTPDGSAILFLRSGPRDTKQLLYEYDVATQKTRELLAPATLLAGNDENLSPEEKARRERMRVSAGGFADYQLSDDGKWVLVSLSGKLFVVERLTGKVRALKTSAGVIQDPKFSPTDQAVGYVLDHDVYVYDLARDHETRVTTGGTEVKPNGLAEFVAQEEMSRFSGYWFAPDGKHLAYQTSDHTGVEQWFVADPLHPDKPPLPQYYPRPGKANVTVSLHLTAIPSDKSILVKWDVAKYPYLGAVRWDKLGGLTIVVQNRLQNEQVLLRVDPATGSTTELHRATDPAWVRLAPDLPRWLPINGQPWLLWSEVSHDHLTLTLNHEKQRLPVCPSFEGDFDSIVSVNAETRTVVFTARPHAPDAHVYRATMAEPGTSVKLTSLTRGRGQQSGQHSASVGKSGLYVIHQHTPTAMPTSTVYSADDRAIGTLPSVALNPPFVPNVTFQQVGKERSLHTAVVRPQAFDPRKKYPVIVDVYGGPGHQHVLAAQRNWLIPQWLADQGFIVVAIDNRGTPGRGNQWEKELYQKFGQIPLDDQVAGLHALAAEFPQLDLGRVGIVGWSFGGYLSALAVLKRPDVFHAAVAGAPVTDWEDYDTHYTERYLGLLPASRAAYDAASLIPLADQLRRPLLLVHGTADDNVYFRHTLKLTNALFRAGRDFETLPLPGLTHMVPDPLITERLWGRIAKHFQMHLKG
jgi:dipeptidyl-peptidase-4